MTFLLLRRGAVRCLKDGQQKQQCAESIELEKLLDGNTSLMIEEKYVRKNILIYEKRLDQSRVVT